MQQEQLARELATAQVGLRGREQVRKGQGYHAPGRQGCLHWPPTYDAANSLSALTPDALQLVHLMQLFLPQDAFRRAAAETGHTGGHAAAATSSSSSGAPAGASAIGQAEVSFTSASAGYGTAAQQDVPIHARQQQQQQQRPVHPGPVVSRLVPDYTPTRSSTITNSDATPASTTFSSEEGLTPLLARHAALRAEQQQLQSLGAHPAAPAGQTAAALRRTGVPAPLPQHQGAVHPAWSQPQTTAGTSTVVAPARTSAAAEHAAATTAASVPHIVQPLPLGRQAAGMAAKPNDDRRRSLFPPSPEGSTSTDTDRDGLSELLRAYRSPLAALSPPSPSPRGAAPSTSSPSLYTTSATSASRGSAIVSRYAREHGVLARPSQTMAAV